jgi:hypothetical protein
MPATAMPHYLAVLSPPVSSPAFLVLVGVVVVALIALVMRLWGPPWWKSRPPRK